ncbi:MAG: ATP-binding protein [Cyclobacteriaceae bacterium]|nr:ATP-binding protein [Cyclobacteriaceae bacterium]
MIRHLYNELLSWKASASRKPLILQGARQVGKTWLMTEFGKTQFKQTVYLNFESSERLKQLFASDFNIQRIISVIEIESRQTISPSDTLLIFDEIQEAEKGLTALKYFYEQAPEYFIVAAGSLLGVSIQKNTSFPVGKVDFLQLHPLSFLEFLENMGPESLTQQLKNHNWDVIQSFHSTLIEHLRLYYFIGGMPEVVASYLENKNLQQVRSLQQKLLLGYENDFAKYAPTQIVPKIRLVWRSIISQLAKENKKFIYGQIKKGARAKDFELAIQWLTDAGLVIKVNRVTKPALPLAAYEEADAFKLYFLDVGLLHAMASLDAHVLLEKNTILTEYKGAATEQFVCQQLVIRHTLFYWSVENATAEVDFLLQSRNEIIPIEVKAEENLKSKSLKVYAEKYSPTTVIRTSMNMYRQESWMTNVPLYAVGISIAE